MSDIEKNYNFDDDQEEIKPEVADDNKATKEDQRAIVRNRISLWEKNTADAALLYYRWSCHLHCGLYDV
ncbi:hypothetical protein [Piscirickettsia litoralis]|uniref:hypothetical protein n=1 Tax=Piscirickettsia litoralis TaxID=1891921 RepID=UPI000980FA7E|nr:hypothetical protein [Piscirickettsia litoralis]